jgi:subtilisin family serine protease
MTQSSFIARTAGLLAAALALAGCGGSEGAAGKSQAWMSGEVAAAWAQGYEGQGVTITVVDEFFGERFAGNLDGSTSTKTHGDWTEQQAQLIAPRADLRILDYYDSAGTSIPLASGLNVINASYGIVAASALDSTEFDRLEQSIIGHAQNGRAVVSKAAGNDAIAVDGFNSDDELDALNIALIGAPSNLFVGALSRNGSVNNKASLASYSNFAGNDPQIQQQFLMVGVDTDITSLAGTSFAAPIVAGYAAILGSKFTSASPTQIANQLLSTARTDTIRNYQPEVHGQGEASIGRALAPSSLR